MRPDDNSGRLPTAQRPSRVLIIAASNWRQYNCPGVDPKARALMLRMTENLPEDWEIDYEDLGNMFGRARIQSCNACVSTAMALCVWPCNCYEPENKDEPDLMWDLDLYARLDLADAWAFIGPVNWQSARGTNRPQESREGEWRSSTRPNGRSSASIISRAGPAAFFCYSDAGENEMDVSGRPKKSRHKAWFDPDDEPFENERDAYRPLAWQCLYSGIEVPDELWSHELTGAGLPYSDNQAEDMILEAEFIAAFDAWIDRFAGSVGRKGKVEPGRYRAYGHEAPGHKWADLKMNWRELRMKMGAPPAASSPAAQQHLALNRDAILSPETGEGEKLHHR